MVAYFVTIIGAFGVVTVLSKPDGEAKDMSDYHGLYWQHPWLSIVFTGMLLSLAGIPLTAGFIAKFYVLAAGVGSTLWLLVIVLIVNSAIGLFYYLRITVAMFSKSSIIETETGRLTVIPLLSRFVLAVLTIGLLWFGLQPNLLISIIKSAAVNMY